MKAVVRTVGTTRYLERRVGRTTVKQAEDDHEPLPDMRDDDDNDDDHDSLTDMRDDDSDPG